VSGIAPYSAPTLVHLVDDSDLVPIGSHDELLAYFRDAGKPASAWRVGTEHELVGVHLDGSPIAYDGPDGIHALLDWFAARGGTPVRENDHPIGHMRGDEQISLEPGGQFELAGRPVGSDLDFVADLGAYTAQLGAAARELGLAFLSTGLRPFGGRGDIPWMPKERYDVMRAYMPTVGTRGLDMMLRTATVQANLDFADEADAAAKMKCVYSISSLLTALWAASPIVEDQVSGFQSYRAWIWRDTDNARSGFLPFVYDREDIFSAYTEWALDVPMYFVYRGGYRPVPDDLTFRRFMAEGWQGEHATRSDWGLHLSTLFPEGRLKKFIEVRGCDCGSLPMILALGPMMRGLLYDTSARTAATALMTKLSFAERQRIADDMPRQGFATKIGAHSAGDLAIELVAIAKAGLQRVAPDAVSLLEPVEAIATSRRTQADRMIELWQQHAGNRAALVKALAHPGLGA